MKFIYSILFALLWIGVTITFGSYLYRMGLPIVNASAQRQTVPRGTQAFRNFTERTNNNYMEKVMRQYRERL